MYNKQQYRSNQFQRPKSGLYRLGRFQKKPDLTIDMSLKSFPTLTPTPTSNNDLSNTCLDFNKMKIRSEDIPTPTPSQTTPDGWVTITRNNHEIVKIYGQPKLSYKPKKLTDHQEVVKCYNILSNHWNNYRDTLNELLGNDSQYWNYKDELKQIIYEERIIQSQIHETGYINSDEEDELYNESTDNYDYY